MQRRRLADVHAILVGQQESLVSRQLHKVCTSGCMFWPIMIVMTDVKNCLVVEHQICPKAIMLAMPGLNHLFQSLGAVSLSAASQAVLQSSCRIGRNALRLPWYVVIAIHEIVNLSSSLIADLADRHGDMPYTARAFSGLAQAYQAPNKKFERGPPATFEQVQQRGS